MGPPRRTDRDENIRAMYEAGMTLKQIGQRYGVTHERVRQILKRLGLTGEHGGKRKCARVKRERHAAARDASHLSRFGVGYEEYIVIRESGGVAAFRQQKANAARRGIGWNLSLGDFWKIWQDSGKWQERGRGKGKYCLSRYTDKGDYTIGNVWVCSFSENCREAHSHSKRGSDNIHFLYPGTRKPWLAKYGRKSIGYFSTREEAEAAKREYLSGLPLREVKGWTFDKKLKSRPYFVQASRNGKKYKAYFATEGEARQAYLRFINGELEAA